MANNILPGIIANYPDGGMKLQRSAAVSDSILIIGTAEDGPKNQPVPIQTLSDVTDIFGNDFGENSLVRGVYEVWNATDVPVDVRALRVGNGTPASLGVKEKDAYYSIDFANWPDRSGSAASGIADQTFSISGDLNNLVDALTLTAKYDGTKYNSFTIQDKFVSEPINGKTGNCIVIHNPFTGEDSAFTYDAYNKDNTSKEVHDILELVDAINNDTNLNPYIEASTTDLTALYEIKVAGTGVANARIIPVSGTTEINPYGVGGYEGLLENAGIDTEWNDDGTPKKVTIQLSYVTTSTDKDSNGIPDAVLAPEPEYGIPSVIKVGPVGNLTYGVNIPTAGNQISLSYVYDIALASGELLSTSGKDTATLENYPINRNGSQGGSGTDKTIVALDGSSITTSEYKEHNVNKYVGTSLAGTETAFAVAAVLKPTINDFAGGTADEADVIDYNNTNPNLRVVVYETIDGVTSPTARTYDIAWAAGVLTVTLGEAPPAGTIITIDYDTIAGTLTEAATKSALEAFRGTPTAYLNYFISGNTIYFAGPMDADIKVSYEHKRVFDIPGEVRVSDSVLGAVEFVNPSKIPQLQRSGGTRVGFNYTYQPEWVNCATPMSLSGGGNGTNMTKKEQYDAIAEAYEAIEDYNVDIVVPMGVYLDDVMDDYSPETGVKMEVNAGFHTQLSSIVNTMTANVGDTIGIIGVKPAASNKLVDVRTWYQKLVIPNANDRNRAANYMPFLADPRISVVAGDVLVSSRAMKLPSSYRDYYTNGVAFYAGLIASLPPNLATTNKNIGRVLLGPRYQLSNNQLNDLSIARYVTIRSDDNVGTVVTMDVTAAEVGSDYDKLSTLRIVKLVMDIVRNICRPYIGQPNTHYKLAAMETEINSGLGRLTKADNQSLKAYDFNVESSPAEARLGNVRVELDIVPVFCINQIHVTVHLKNVI